MSSGEQDADAAPGDELAEELPTYATEIEKFFAMVTQMVVLAHQNGLAVNGKNSASSKSTNFMPKTGDSLRGMRGSPPASLLSLNKAHLIASSGRSPLVPDQNLRDLQNAQNAREMLVSSQKNLVSSQQNLAAGGAGASSSSAQPPKTTHAEIRLR